MSTKVQHPTHPPVEIDGAVLVGPAEVAAMFGVLRNTVLTWHTVYRILPKATFISGHPVWPYSAMEKWGLETGRLIHTDLTKTGVIHTI